MLDLKLEDIGSFALVGLIISKSNGTPHTLLEEEVKITFRNINLGVDIFQEVVTLQNFFPKAKISLFRDGTRELWGGKPRKKKDEDD